MIVTSIHGFIITLRFRKYNPKHFYGVFGGWMCVLIDKMAIIAA
jgi:acyl-CoA hydrolase